MSAEDGAPERELPQNAPRAEEVAIHIDLPSQRGSLDSSSGSGVGSLLTFDGFQLEAIDAHSRVHPAHEEIFKDKRTGKHYKKVVVAPPTWSIAHAAQKNKGQATVEGKRAHGTKFSVGHTIGAADKRGEHGTAGSRTPGTGTGGATTPVSTAAQGMSGSDMDKLVEKLRSVVRQEVRLANIGHAEHLERVVVENTAAPVMSSSSEKEFHLSSDKSEMDQHHHQLDTKQVDGGGGGGSSSDGDGKTRHITETEAARGIDTESDVEEAFPNGWAKIRYKCREPFAEFLGCFILITFGTGGDIQALMSETVTGTALGQYLSVSFGWGIGVAMAVWVSGGISGQLNPAVTLSLALFRGFPWRKVPIYWFAQISGACLGGLSIIGLYWNPLQIADPGKTQATAQYLTTFPAAFLEPAGARISGFYNEVYATAVLLMVIVAINDGSNTPPPEGMAPLVLLWLVTGLGACLGWQTAYAVNPARDLGPRIALSMVGYKDLFTFNAWYWIRTPLLGPLVGGPLGVFIYDALIYTGSDSPLNKPWKWSDVRWRRTSKKKIPAGLDH